MSQPVTYLFDNIHFYNKVLATMSRFNPNRMQGCFNSRGKWVFVLNVYFNK